MPVLITATVSKNQRSPHEIAELLSHFSSLSLLPRPSSLSSISRVSLPDFLGFHPWGWQTAPWVAISCQFHRFFNTSIFGFLLWFHPWGWKNWCLPLPCQFLDFLWNFIHVDEKLMLTYVTPVSSILKPQLIFGFLLRFHPRGWETDAFQCNCPFSSIFKPSPLPKPLLGFLLGFHP
jgi:hypothetical protein